MKKLFFILGTILLVGGLVWYFFFQSNNIANAPENKIIESAENGWIEVENRGVYLVNIDGTLGAELQQGDEIVTGQTLMTDKTGLVSLHFFDGSELRMESETKISLDNFNYFSDDKSLKVKISLQTGKVWSRIKALMTPESYWEVQTTNAVAAVRGTSFGVSYIPGQTTIIGSVHLININVIDSQTKELIKDNTAYVGENQYIIINDQEIKGLATGVKLTSKVRTYSAKIKNDPWVVQSKEKDNIADDQLKPEEKPEISDEPLTKLLEKKEEQIVNTTTERDISQEDQNSTHSSGSDNSFLEEANDPTGVASPILDDNSNVITNTTTEDNDINNTTSTIINSTLLNNYIR